MTGKLSLFVALLCVLACTTSGTSLQCPTKPKTIPKELSISAFNIQNLGKQKMAKPEIVEVILKILSKYNLIFIQEIVDRKQRVIQELVDKLNSECQTRVYNFTVSERIGRSAQKEQYAYVYSKDYLRLVKAYIYHDKDDVFEREPYVATFDVVKSSKNGLKQFTAVGIHTKPSTALNEIQNLHHVVQTLEKQGLQDIVLLGDFNADCGYVRKKHWKNIELWTNAKYEWLIDSETDTTATDSNCAYDRIVITGTKMKNSAVKGSARPVRYDKELGLSSEQTAAVSDHFPVEFRVRLSSRK